MLVCDWYTGARSGWTGSSVVGVHCMASQGGGASNNPSGWMCVCCVCLSVCDWGGGSMHVVNP